jgi:hypothetical protein
MLGGAQSAAAVNSSDETGGTKPGLLLACLPIALTLVVLGVQLFYFEDFTPHIPLAIGLAITCAIGWLQGYRWKELEKGVFHVINVALPSVSVLIVVGMIIGVWIASGTVPTLIYYGLNLLSPQVFLAAAMLLCSIVSLALGTSWGTTGTVGLALMGIGEGFGIPMYWTAGAVVSGAFFGDKISPLSDTTNLAPAVTGTNLFDHIRNMLPTTVPSMLIALVIYAVVGFAVMGPSEASFAKIETITSGLDANFHFSWRARRRSPSTLTRCRCACSGSARPDGCDWSAGRRSLSARRSIWSCIGASHCRTIRTACASPRSMRRVGTCRRASTTRSVAASWSTRAPASGRRSARTTSPCPTRFEPPRDCWSTAVPTTSRSAR